MPINFPIHIEAYNFMVGEIVWNGLSHDTRKGYASAIESYELSHKSDAPQWLSEAVLLVKE
jgi:hypothetical protein